MNGSRTLAFAGLTVVCAGIGLPAQALSSKSFFISSVELANGGTTFSTNYTNSVAIGAGVVPSQMFSANFRITGGYAATLDVATGGRPWITHVSPGEVTTNGLGKLTIHGINLDLGTNPAIDVGGKPATFLSRTAEKITVTQPALTAPGHPHVSVSNNLGSSAVSRSVGVLPLIETNPAPASKIPFDIVFRGTRGDVVIWAVGALKTPAISLPPILHGLGMHPAAMLILPGFGITSPDGVFRFSSPPTKYSGPIYVQAIFRTTNPGYAPASFTNVLTL